MQLHADFSRRVAVHAAPPDWQPSPMQGVERHMLDRVGGEIARATSIVRYAPHSRFSPHVHTGGEEFLVLEGVFQDEHGDFPAGSYIRNPPESRHTPGSEPGCVILVKLWQFDLTDRIAVRTHIDRIGRHADSARPGVTVTPLYRDARDGREEVRIEQWPAGAMVSIDAAGGAEIFVLEGGFTERDESFARWSWLRTPSGSEPVEVVAGPVGARVWVKSGHLRGVVPDLARFDSAD